MSSASNKEIPEVIVHNTDTGSKPENIESSVPKCHALKPNKAGTCKVRINDLQSLQKGEYIGSTSSLGIRGSLESGSMKTKKTGKPSRRWLSMEIDKLFKSNIQLASQLKEKQGKEEEQNVVRRRLESELAVLRASTNLSEMESLRKKNKELSQDVFMMKNLVVKLTKELGKSQERVRNLRKKLNDKNEDNILSDDSGLDIKYTSRRGGNEHILPDGEVAALWPLVCAYEECLADKKSLIARLRADMDAIAGRTRVVVEENDELMKRLANNQTKGEVSYGEYLHQQKELSIVVEQNQLLVRQSKLNQAKMVELRQAFQSHLTESCMERDNALSELHQTKTELLMIKGRFSLLQDEYRAAREEADNKIPAAVHTASINECKRLLDELKVRYDDERESLVRRLATLEAGRPDVDARLAALCSERDRLLGQLDALNKTIKRLENKCADVEDKLLRAEKCKEALKSQLTSAVSFSGELLQEQEKLVKQLLEKAEEAKMGATIGKRLQALKVQVKGVEMETEEHMGLLDSYLKNQDEYIGNIKEKYSSEIQKLKNDIAGKEAAIGQLTEQNKKALEELDIVWKATTTSEAPT